MVVGGWLCCVYGGVVVVGMGYCSGNGWFVFGVVVGGVGRDVVGVVDWLVLGVCVDECVGFVVVGLCVLGVVCVVGCWGWVMYFVGDCVVFVWCM